jgi:hypothetical protein
MKGLALEHQGLSSLMSAGWTVYYAAPVIFMTILGLVAERLFNGTSDVVFALPLIFLPILCTLTTAQITRSLHFFAFRLADICTELKNDGDFWKSWTDLLEKGSSELRISSFESPHQLFRQVPVSCLHELFNIPKAGASGPVVFLNLFLYLTVLILVAVAFHGKIALCTYIIALFALTEIYLCAIVATLFHLNPLVSYQSLKKSYRQSFVRHTNAMCS